ncbi:MAG: EamA family transporter [Lachnospiraceae bacterium]|nr:EamA family transporter [Lachnospiraceae bacterium]
MKRMAPLSIILAGSLWGMLGAFVRVICGYGFSTLQLTCLRCILTFLCLLLFLAVYDRSLLRIQRKDVWIFLGTGICSIAFFSLCYFQTIEMTSLSTAVILLYTSPIFVTILSAVLFQEAITPRKITALLLAFAGCILITGVLQGSMNLTPFALLCGLGAGLGYALYSIFGHFAVEKYHPFTITLYTFLFASIVTVPFCRPPVIVQLFSQHPGAAVPIIVSSILCSVLPYIFYTAGLAHVEAGKAAILAAIEPVVGTLVSVFYLKEPLTGTSLAGIFFVLTALILLNLKSKAKGELQT